eukprot:122299_1
MSYVPPHKRQSNPMGQKQMKKFVEKGNKHNTHNYSPWNRDKQEKKQAYLQRRNVNINFRPTLHERKSNPLRKELNFISNAISAAKFPQDVIKILNDEEYKNMQDAVNTIHSQAINKLIKSLHSYDTVYDAMDIIHDRHIHWLQIMYQGLISTLCQDDKLDQALTVLQHIEKQNIPLNCHLFTSLIAGCKRKGDVKTADELWNKMTTEYDITPDRTSYMSVIGVYANANDVAKCESKFKEIINQTTSNELMNLGPICNSMLKVYGSSKNQNKTIEIHKFMLENEMPLTLIESTTIMRNYMMLGDYSRVFEIFHQLESKKMTLDKVCIGVLGATYLKCIKSECIKSEQSVKLDEYLTLLKDTIPEQYPMLINNKYKRCILRGVLWKYLNKWEEPIVYDIFNNLTDTHVVGYWSKQWRGSPILDVHGMSHITAKFVLRHVFCNDKDNLIRCKPEEIFIICGKGKHRVNQHRHTIKETVINELKRWVPSIKTYDEINEGRIRLNPYDVMQFVKMHKHNDINVSSNCFPKLPNYELI